MNTVYALSRKGQLECAAERPMLLRELHDLLRLVDGRRTRADLLNSVGKNAITVGGLRWLTSTGYIYPQALGAAAHSDRGPVSARPCAELPAAGRSMDLYLRPAVMSDRGDANVHQALADFMSRSVERHLGEAGVAYQRRIERAATVGELLPLLNPLLEAVLARAGHTCAMEFAEAAALLLQPLEQRAQ